jgi:CheY-like chemotaxis protein
MKKKLNSILLIDDNEADNRFHQIVLEDMGVAENIQMAESGIDALNLLEEDQITPELIFLDINMPRMNGWEFLEKYKNLAPEHRAKMIVVMLSTSSNPEDLKKAEQIPEVAEFQVKPLSKKMISEIMERYFAIQIEN